MPDPLGNHIHKILILWLVLQDLVASSFEKYANSVDALKLKEEIDRKESKSK